MKNVLLIQLPIPFLVPNKMQAWGFNTNTPIASGYLKASCYKEGLLSDYNIEILDKDIANYAGTAYLQDYIKDKKPDIIGISLYSWNTPQSLYIIGKLKELNPETLIIAGGPEIPLSGVYPEIHGNIDIAVRGAGEETFAELLKCIKLKGDLGNIDGIAYKDNSKINLTPPRKLTHLNYPSPYLLGYLDFDPDYSFYMFSRGCPFTCLYCCWGHLTDKTLYFSEEQVKNELILAQQSGVKHICLMDSNLNTNPKAFKRFISILNEVDPDKMIKFEGFFRAELFNEEMAQLLSKNNFNTLMIGLQSMSPETLKNISRNNRFNKWLNGIKIISKRNFNISIDVMIGLPGDTIEAIKNTVDFLVENELNMGCLYSPLSVFPASDLWHKKDFFGLKTQNNAPHLVMETKEMSFEGMKEAINYAISKGDERCMFMEPFVPYNYPFLCQYSGKISNYDKYNPSKDTFPITKIIVENYNSLSDYMEILSRRLSNSVVLWLKNGFEKNIDRLKLFIEKASKDNPYNMWHIIFEPDGVFDLSIINNIESWVKYLPNYLDYHAIYLADNCEKEYMRFSTQIYTILGFGNDYNPEFIDSINNASRLIWKIDGGFNEISENIRKIFSLPAKALLFSIKEIPNQRLQEFFQLLNNNNNRKTQILFDNWVYQHLWKNFLNDTDFEGVDEHIILVKDQIYSNTFSLDNLKNDLKTWQNT